MNTLFDLAFLAATPFWLLMILLPAWSWTRRIVSSYLITLPVLAVWAVAAAPATIAGASTMYVAFFFTFRLQLLELSVLPG